MRRLGGSEPEPPTKKPGTRARSTRSAPPLRDLDLDRPRRQFINPVSRMVVLVPKNGKAQVPGLIESNSQGYDPERRLTGLLHDQLHASVTGRLGSRPPARSNSGVASGEHRRGLRTCAAAVIWVPDPTGSGAMSNVCGSGCSAFGTPNANTAWRPGRTSPRVPRHPPVTILAGAPIRMTAPNVQHPSHDLTVARRQTR